VIFGRLVDETPAATTDIAAIDPGPAGHSRADA
jgi:hypothetical protein